MIEFCAVLVIGDEGPGVLHSALAGLRTHYGSVPLSVISDGVSAQGYQPVCDRYDAQYILDRYYARIECGGRWWQRTLAVGLARETPWIVSFDPSLARWPDLGLEPLRPVRGIPQETQPERLSWPGCQAICRNAAIKLFDSGYLNSPELTKYEHLCGSAHIPRAWVPTGYVAQPLLLRHACLELGIDWDDWPSEPGDHHPPQAPRITQGSREASDTPLTIVATCKGRRHHLEQTLPGWLAQRHVAIVVVDYDCPDDTAEWLSVHYPQVCVAAVRQQRTFNLARARNIGALAAPDGWWAFLDADTMIATDWADAVRPVLRSNHYHLADPVTSAVYGSCIVHSDDFRRAGGYDDVIEGWGAEDLDLYGRLRQCGVRPAIWEGPLAHSIRHSDHERTRFYDHDKRTSAAWNGQYVWAKHALMVDTWSVPTREECVTLRAALTRLQTSGDARPVARTSL